MIINYKNECFSCKNENLVELKKYKKFYLVKCKKCGLIFSNRIPLKDELNIYDYFDRNDYKNVVQKEKNRLFVDKIINDHSIKSVLDIGCHTGDILDEFKLKNLNTYFTEYEDKDLISFVSLKGHKYISGGFYPNTKLNFDLIYLGDVIEHVDFPDQMMEIISKNLQNKNQYLYINTPNFNSIERILLGNKYNIFSYPEHLTYFTVRSLNRFIESYGYKKIYAYSDNISIIRIFQFFKIGLKKKKIPQAKNKEKELLVNFFDDYQEIINKSKLIYFKKIITIVLKYIGLGTTIKALYVKLDN